MLARDEVGALLQRLVASHAALAERRPLIVAIDGRSGSGKSTLAAAIAEELGDAHCLRAEVIDGDDFFIGGVTVRPEPPQVLAEQCIDWRRQRAVLTALRAGAEATWRAFDWEAFDGSRKAEPRVLDGGQTDVVLLEGVYSARPELAELLDLRVLLNVPDDVRESRLRAREGGLGPWERQWHAAEAHYFRHLAPPSHFDLTLAA